MELNVSILILFEVNIHVVKLSYVYGWCNLRISNLSMYWDLEGRTRRRLLAHIPVTFSLAS